MKVLLQNSKHRIDKEENGREEKEEVEIWKSPTVEEIVKIRIEETLNNCAFETSLKRVGVSHEEKKQ